MARQSDDVEIVDELGVALREFFAREVQPEVIRTTTEAVRRILDEHDRRQSILRDSVQAASAASLAELRSEAGALREVAESLQRNGRQHAAALERLEAAFHVLDDAVRALRATATGAATHPDDLSQKKPARLREAQSEARPRIREPSKVIDQEAGESGTRKTAVGQWWTSGAWKESVRRNRWIWATVMAGIAVLIFLLVAVVPRWQTARLQDQGDMAPEAGVRDARADQALERGWAQVRERLGNECRDCGDFDGTWGRPAVQRPSHAAILQTALNAMDQARPECEVGTVSVSGLWGPATQAAAAAAATCLDAAELGPRPDSPMEPGPLRALTEAVLRAAGAPPGEPLARDGETDEESPHRQPATGTTGAPAGAGDAGGSSEQGSPRPTTGSGDG